MSAARGQLFEHPENAPVWSGFLTLGAEAQWEFLDAITDRLACGEQLTLADRRKSKGIADLREAEPTLRGEGHDGPLTPPHYKRLYQQQGRMLGWTALHDTLPLVRGRLERGPGSSAAGP